METLDYFIIARAFHILGILLWIGGVAFVTTVLIPAIKQIPDANDRLGLFERLESKFALQAKLMTLLVVITGVYMIEVLNAWDRYLLLEFWWMHLMTFIWLVFSLVLFVLEPLVLHRLFREQAIKNSDLAFGRLHTMHKILLFLSLIAIFGAMAGSHGLTFF